MKKLFKFSKKHLWLLLSLCIMAVFCRANIYSMHPFGYSLAFALVYNNFYSLMIITFFCIFSLLTQFSFSNVIICLSGGALLLIFYILSKITKKHNLVTCLILCAFSQIATIYFCFSSLKLVLLAIANLIVGLVFCFFMIKLVCAFRRGIQTFTKLEKVYFCVGLVALFCGITNINLFIDISKVLFVLVILVGSLVLKSKTVYIACLIAVAHILSGLSAFDGMVYFILSCVASWVSPYNKILAGCLVCLVDAVMGLFIEYHLINLIPVAIATIVFICIPQKTIKKWYGYIVGSNHSLISAFYMSKRQELLKNKLSDMSLLFKQMQKCYSDLLLGSTQQVRVVNVLATELKNQVCENCINRHNCENLNMLTCFEDLIARTQLRGTVNVLDIPPLLSSNCTRVNSCLSIANQLAIEYRHKSDELKIEDETKMNISRQLGGTSQIFSRLSSQFAVLEKVNIKKSNKIREYLLSQGLICNECVATEYDNVVHEVLLIVRNDDVLNTQILVACERYYNMKFEKKLYFQTAISGWSMVCAVPSNRYDLMFGYSSKPKESGCKNGDNYVYTKLTDSKFLIAICDGMGHGESANNISTLAINLIESYYKCGLSGQVVVDSVNNILLPLGEQNFSTLDACVIDSISGEVEFIKIGSTISVVKSQNQIQIIDVESLPLGISEICTPTTHKSILFGGDMVILVSDGIVDSFGQTEFCNYINNENVINAQLLAESILEEATNRNVSHKDDMTVIVCRLVQKK